MRVHELAKELSLTSKEVIAKLKDLGSDVKSHMSLVDESAAQLVRLAAAPESKSIAAPATPVAAPARPQPQQEQKPAEPDTGRPETHDNAFTIRGSMVVKDLALRLDVRPNQLIAELMAMNVFASINDKLDFNVTQKIAAKYGVSVEREKKGLEHKAPSKAWEEMEEDDLPGDMLARPPVVAFLGHVDHGKTSLLDRIRNTSVAKGESGGITQHIGAYTLEVHGKSITFLDTPGHAAFTAMRARGANLTDIVVIVIAADDGIMPQTEEAIQHARAANTTIIVAINKIDLPSANPNAAKQQLQAMGITPEEWGGETLCCEVSAQTGQGMEHLLEMILLQAEMLDLKVNPKRKARGFVIEAQLETGMGPTANLLVKQGTLKLGDIILCSTYCGRVKALINDRGKKIKEAGPSTPVKCLGLSGVPESGAEFRTCADEKIARQITEEASALQKERQLAAPKKASLQDLYARLDSAEKPELRLILKSDVHGSLEAIRHALGSIESGKVSLNILLAGVGNITTNDTLLASASKAIVIGFNVAKENGVSAIAKREGVEIRLHSIIYELVDEIQRSMTGLLAPQLTESVVGHAQILEVFAISKLGNVAGCMVLDGYVSSKSRARLKRSNDVVYEGSVSSLRRFQNDVSQVTQGQECGIRLDNFANFEKDDSIEFFEVNKSEQSL